MLSKNTQLNKDLKTLGSLTIAIHGRQTVAGKTFWIPRLFLRLLYLHLHLEDNLAFV